MEKNNDNDLFVFADDNDSGELISFDSEQTETAEPGRKEKAPWKLLIVDDDQEIHSITNIVLEGYSFDDRPLKTISAYSGDEAVEILRKENDIALVLLDVVMETDDAGLICAKKIREELKNDTIRIILRTGQPGQAPEREVITEYDINDYKSKTELTAQKLFTTLTASFRSYGHLETINKNREGLEFIISASNKIFTAKPLKVFIVATLNLLRSFIEKIAEGEASGVACYRENGGPLKIISAAGGYSEIETDAAADSSTLPGDVMEKIDLALKEKRTVIDESSVLIYSEAQQGEVLINYLDLNGIIPETEKNLLTIFGSNISIAFDNICLSNEIIETQKEVIITLSEVVEGRSKATAEHIKRVTGISEMLAAELNLSEKEIELIKLACPMHDVGKVGIPDSILTKPGKLTEEEYEEMKEHTTIGYNIFKNSQREMMVAAGIVAHQHHEKWDGTGYPQGLKGEEIHIFGRIVAVADVVDALANSRCYKEPWELEKIIQLIEEEKGRHFDPEIADVFLQNIDKYKEIQNR